MRGKVSAELRLPLLDRFIRDHLPFDTTDIKSGILPRQSRDASIGDKPSNAAMGNLDFRGGEAVHSSD